MIINFYLDIYPYSNSIQITLHNLDLYYYFMDKHMKQFLMIDSKNLIINLQKIYSKPFENYFFD